MSIQRYEPDYEYYCLRPHDSGDWVEYEDHAELMADLQRQLDEAEALLADAKAAQEDLEERLTRAEEEVSDLQSSLYTYTDTD